jgi:hypothetical protein
MPLWIWLGMSVVTGFFGTPADPVSVLTFLSIGLVYFWAGAILASSLNIVIRVLPAILCIVAAIPFVGVGFHGVVLLSYCAGSMLFGFWASRSIDTGRFRIIACFSAGYVLGCVFGAVLGAILAKGSLREHSGDGGTECGG